MSKLATTVRSPSIRLPWTLSTFRKRGKVNENGFLVCHPRAVGSCGLIFKGYAEVQKNIGTVKGVIKMVNVSIFVVYQPDL